MKMTIGYTAYCEVEVSVPQGEYRIGKNWKEN